MLPTHHKALKQPLDNRPFMLKSKVHFKIDEQAEDGHKKVRLCVKAKGLSSWQRQPIKVT
jgi:hypothetical protein